MVLLAWSEIWSTLTFMGARSAYIVLVGTTGGRVESGD